MMPGIIIINKMVQRNKFFLVAIIINEEENIYGSKTKNIQR
jgi:3-hydroxymyristoyl/3-hydroxydecanoyl-(acyl carrier protein) dehydratase